MHIKNVVFIVFSSCFLLAARRDASAGELSPAHVSLPGDRGIEAAANNAIAALRSFGKSPDGDSLADLHRAGRTLSSQLNRYYSYFGPKASQKFEGSLRPILAAITSSLEAYKELDLNKQGTELTMRAVAECEFFISSRSLTR